MHSTNLICPKANSVPYIAQRNGFLSNVRLCASSIMNANVVRAYKLTPNVDTTVFGSICYTRTSPMDIYIFQQRVCSGQSRIFLLGPPPARDMNE